jgi:hypothetical protein
MMGFDPRESPEAVVVADVVGAAAYRMVDAVRTKPDAW